MALPAPAFLTAAATSSVNLSATTALVPKEEDQETPCSAVATDLCNTFLLRNDAVL